MKRLTNEEVRVDESVDRYLGPLADLEGMKPKLLDLILNGPVLNGVSKDVLRQIIRQLYSALAAYEDTGITAEEPAADEPAVPKLPTVRLFISQPMRGKSDEEIEREREDLIAIAKAVYAGRGEVEVIDSFFKGGLDVPAGTKAPLYHLSKSLELLATADVAIFAEDWREARGCRIERECADGYGVARIKLPKEG